MTTNESMQSTVTPTWGILIGAALLLGGGGYTAGRVSQSSEQPAVLAAAQASLRDELASTRSEIRELDQALRKHTADRFTRADHAMWVSREYIPLREQLAEHAGLAGHSTGMRALDDLRQEQRVQEERIRRLERQLVKETPP